MAFPPVKVPPQDVERFQTELGWPSSLGTRFAGAAFRRLALRLRVYMAGEPVASGDP